MGRGRPGLRLGKKRARFGSLRLPMVLARKTTKAALKNYAEKLTDLAHSSLSESEIRENLQAISKELNSSKSRAASNPVLRRRLEENEAQLILLLSGFAEGHDLEKALTKAVAVERKLKRLRGSGLGKFVRTLTGGPRLWKRARQAGKAKKK